MHRVFLKGNCIARFFVTVDDRFCGESNASFVARISWKHRIKPAQLLSKAILGKANANIDLIYGVASICNSLTDKSLFVQNRLYELTGVDRSFGNYTYLRDLVDHAAHGLISKDKKWCHLCYEERREFSVPADETPIFDDIYWSFRHAVFCTEHHCTLSNKCGHCFQKQPYISNKMEPGFCHHCGKFLGKAPSIGIDDDTDADEAVVMALKRHDLFIRNEVPLSRISMRILARNLRQLSSRFGVDGMSLVSDICGVSSATYADWCRVKHNLTVESLFMLLEGLDLPTIGFLLSDEDDFCNAVSPQLSSQFQFRTKKHHESVLPAITRHINAIIKGSKPAESRDAIAKRFDVSVGMLENTFQDELMRVSYKYRKANEESSLENKESLQYLLDVAVRRCGAKMRKFDWEHILAEMKGINLNGYSFRQLSDARVKAIRRYIHSSRRDQSRNIDSLI